MAKKYKFILLSVTVFTIFGTILPIAALAGPTEYEYHPTSWNFEWHWLYGNWGYHTGGSLSDVETNDGDTMNFQQKGAMLKMRFYFPHQKYNELHIDFTDTCTWPFDYSLSVRVYYTVGPEVLLHGGLSDGYYTFDLDDSKYVNYVLINMHEGFYQFLRIDYLATWKY